MKNLFNGHSDDDENGKKKEQEDGTSPPRINHEDEDGGKRLKLEEEINKLPDFRPLGKGEVLRIPKPVSTPEQQDFEIDKVI